MYVMAIFMSWSNSENHINRTVFAISKSIYEVLFLPKAIVSGEDFIR